MNTLKKLAVAALTAALAVALFPAPAHAAARDSSFQVHPSGKGWCATLNVPVSPAEGQARSWTVAATYCQPFRWTREVDILTHGATYDHTYWDWPQQPNTYSYVGKTLADGRAAVAYDRIGNGASTRPLSTEITMTSDAWVLHQLVHLLRCLGYRHINSISHSYGSAVALAEAATTYPDAVKVDAVVLTGYLHRSSNPAVTAGNYPANQDPKFAAAGLDNGYLTSRPGVRGTSFHAPTSDPEIVAYDDAHKDLVSLTGLLGFLAARGVPPNDNISNLVSVPVLVVNGQQDAIFCYQPAVFNCADQAAVAANEAPYYGDVEVHTVPDSGHDLTLHPSATVSYTIISTWIKEQS